MLRRKTLNSYIGWAITLALAMFSLATNFEPHSIFFGLTVLCCLIATGCSIWRWQRSEFLRRRNPDKWPKRKRQDATTENRIVYGLWQWGISLVLCVSLMLCVWVIWYEAEQVELRQLQGELYPGSDPMPVSKCSSIELKPNEFLFDMGAIAITSEKFPYSVIKVNDKDRLFLTRDTAGTIRLSLDVLSPDGKVITRIREGQFVINENNSLRFGPRSDRSSLQVVDQYGEEVIALRYLNKQSMKIRGILRFPDLEYPIVISETEVTLNKGASKPTSVANFCFSGGTKFLHLKSDK